MEVLKAGGLLLDSGMAGIRETVRMTVLVEATDGYRAVFSLAELDPELTDRVILLADTKDSQPLPPREGPFRIIVPGEKRPALTSRNTEGPARGKSDGAYTPSHGDFLQVINSITAPLEKIIADPRTSVLRIS